MFGEIYNLKVSSNTPVPFIPSILENHTFCSNFSLGEKCTILGKRKFNYLAQEDISPIITVNESNSVTIITNELTCDTLNGKSPCLMGEDLTLNDVSCTSLEASSSITTKDLLTSSITNNGNLTNKGTINANSLNVNTLTATSTISTTTAGGKVATDIVQVGTVPNGYISNSGDICCKTINSNHILLVDPVTHQLMDDVLQVNQLKSNSMTTTNLTFNETSLQGLNKILFNNGTNFNTSIPQFVVQYDDQNSKNRFVLGRYNQADFYIENTGNIFANIPLTCNSNFSSIGNITTTGQIFLRNTKLQNTNQIFFQNSNGSDYSVQLIDNGGANYLRLGRTGNGDLAIDQSGNVTIPNLFSTNTQLGPTTITGRLSVTGDSTEFLHDVTIDGKLNLNNEVNFTNTDVNFTSLNSSQAVLGTTTIQSSFNITSPFTEFHHDVTIDGRLDLQGPAVINGSCSLSSGISLNNASKVNANQISFDNLETPAQAIQYIDNPGYLRMGRIGASDIEISEDGHIKLGTGTLCLISGANNNQNVVNFQSSFAIQHYDNVTPQYLSIGRPGFNDFTIDNQGNINFPTGKDYTYVFGNDFHFNFRNNSFITQDNQYNLIARYFCGGVPNGYVSSDELAFENTYAPLPPPATISPGRYFISFQLLLFNSSGDGATITESELICGTNEPPGAKVGSMQFPKMINYFISTNPNTTYQLANVQSVNTGPFIVSAQGGKKYLYLNFIYNVTSSTNFWIFFRHNGNIPLNIDQATAITFTPLR